MTDTASIDALDVAERYANGQATADELNVAWFAAGAAWDAAGDARVAARAAAWDAARATAWDAALGAAGAVWDAARTAERKWQEKEFKRVFCGGEK